MGYMEIAEIHMGSCGDAELLMNTYSHHTVW